MYFNIELYYSNKPNLDGLMLRFIPDCMNVCLHPVCLPASIDHSSGCLYPDDLHSCLPMPPVCLSLSLSSCLFTRCVCTSAFLHSMHTSILKEPVLLSVVPHSSVETPELGRDTRIHGPEPAGAAASLSWQRVPTVGTLWHRWARGKYRGEEEMTVHRYSWGVTDKAGPPSQHTTKKEECTW